MNTLAFACLAIWNRWMRAAICIYLSVYLLFAWMFFIVIIWFNSFHDSFEHGAFHFAAWNWELVRCIDQWLVWHTKGCTGTPLQRPSAFSNSGARVCSPSPCKWNVQWNRSTCITSKPKTTPLTGIASKWTGACKKMEAQKILAIVCIHCRNVTFDMYALKGCFLIFLVKNSP